MGALRRGVLIATLALVVLPAAADATRSAGTSRCAVTAPSGFRCYRGHGLSFIRPGGWHPRHYEFDTSYYTVLVYLSNQRMYDPCHRTAQEMTCHSPVGRLRPGGVLVTWLAAGNPGQSKLPPSPGRTTIGGHVANVSIAAADEECRLIGGDESYNATIETGMESNFWDFSACLRGLHLERSERYVRRLLATTRFG